MLAGLVSEGMGKGLSDSQSGDESGRRDQARQHLAAAYDACADELFRYAVMLLADPVLAEDVVHQASAKLAGRNQRLGQIEEMRAYLRRAVRNECYRLVAERTRRGRTDRDSRMLLEPARPDELPVSPQLRRNLEESLRALPPEQREVIHMKVYEKMTFQRIAQLQGTSINTVASRYRYGLQRLRELMAPHAEGQE